MKKTIDQNIVDILTVNTITEQSELTTQLKAMGITIPQSTLSRRLNKLGISKTRGVYTQLAMRQSDNPQILHIDISPPNLMVIHTSPGSASSVAYILDQHLAFKTDLRLKRIKGILGTIAGDDTVMVMTDQQYPASEIKRSILRLLKL